MPEDDDVVSECRNRGAVGRHRVVGEIPGNDLPEPFSCFRNRLVHLPSQSFLDFLELGPHAVTARLPLDLEITPPRFAANEHKTQELEGLRLGEPALLAVLRRKATELNQAGLVRVKRQRELPQPFAHRVPKAPSLDLSPSPRSSRSRLRERRLATISGRAGGCACRRSGAPGSGPPIAGRPP